MSPAHATKVLTIFIVAPRWFVLYANDNDFSHIDQPLGIIKVYDVKVSGTKLQEIAELMGDGTLPVSCSHQVIVY